MKSACSEGHTIFLTLSSACIVTNQNPSTPSLLRLCLHADMMSQAVAETAYAQ